MACHAPTNEVSGQKCNNLSVCLVKGSWYWSQELILVNISTRKNDGNYFKSFCHSVQNQRREGKREKKLEWVKLEPPPWSQGNTKFSGHKFCEKIMLVMWLKDHVGLRVGLSQ